MGKTVAEKIIEEHIVEGIPKKGEEIGIRIDQTLTQDATGTMVYLEFEALGLDRVNTELSVSYVDHNLLQTDFKNADDHIFLQSSAQKYGIYFSKPGNGISHQVHLERFSVPGKTLLGSDSHTPTNGGCSMLAIGAGGLDVAVALAGQPFYLTYPKIMGVRLSGKLGPWVSAKDVILEILRRLTVQGGFGYIIEYFGPGVKNLSVTDRATIANMGAELGATTTVFPSDENTRFFLASQGREHVWQEIKADPDAYYDKVIEIDLSQLEPLIACPSSPDNVKKVAEMEGVPVSQVIVGSCANSSYRDLMIVAKAMEGRKVHERVSFEVNTGSGQVLENVAASGGLLTLIRAGTRIHQSGCLGCIGMGQAPATGTASLRTFPRNFPGRSGTKNDLVYLCSPETAAAAAIFGKITDPRNIGSYPEVKIPEKYIINDTMIIPPPKDASKVEIIRGPNIKPFPHLSPLNEDVMAEVVLKVGDNITTDHILPAGNRILPLRSNIPAISKYVYEAIDPNFSKKTGGKKAVAVVGGENYGQGSSREHAALAPIYLGVRLKIAKSFARIHKANLVNFGVVPLVFVDPQDYGFIKEGDTISIRGLKSSILRGEEIIIAKIRDREIKTRLDVSPRYRKILAAGGLLNFIKGQG